MNLSYCQSCKQRIMYLTTVNGKQMPVDSLAYIDGNLVVEPGTETVRVIKKDEIITPEIPRFKSHFATCRFANRHKRK